MSQKLPIDVNSRPVPALQVGYGETFGPGTVTIYSDDVAGHIIRMKALSDSEFRLEKDANSVIVIGEGDIDYFFLPRGEKLVIISGSINIMW